MDKNKLCEKIRKIKHIAEESIIKKNFDESLEAIKLCAAVEYASNICYADRELEELLSEVARGIVSFSGISFADEKSVVFYDGFGLETRGLALIYLKALSKIKKIHYITYQKNSSRLGEIEDVVKGSGGQIYYLDKIKKVDLIEELMILLSRFNCKNFFYYSLPDDVVATTVLTALENKVTRFQINLTDHAFWLGASCVDICIEFRRYGAYISNHYRGIAKNKLRVVPFYPVVKENVSFQGFPFNVNNANNIIFSGGQLYKTNGGENNYYKIVEYYLQLNRNNLFWYAGSGNNPEMDRLLKKYPEQLFFTSERKDLLEVLKHCTLYLSTYPVCGGLMFQYAAKAGILPLTLKYDSISDDFLMNQGQLGIEFKSLDEIKNEIQRVLDDPDYRRKKESDVRNAIITEEKFNEAVSELFSLEKSALDEISVVDTEKLLLEYLNNFDEKGFEEILSKKEFLFMAKYFPIAYIKGSLRKIKEKISKG